MFENLPNVNRVGIKMSGGADSSLLAYLLAKYIAHSKLDIELFPIIIIEKSAPFQEQFVKSVIQFLVQ